VPKVELYERIRRDHVEQGWGIRRLSKEHRCHRREVRQALSSAVPPEGAELSRGRPVLGPWIPTIDAMLAEDQKAPRKQKHTAHRIYVRLVNECGARIGEPTVRAWVRERRRELYGTVEAMVPQVHDPGEEAEVDLSEADVDFDWGRETVTFFQMRGCHSGAVFHGPLRAETQQAFLEAHAEAFEHFDGVFPRVRYDNLSSAVRKILRGRTRLESERFTLLRSHYLFTAEFCQPGLRGAHEKGGVEGEVGYFRRNHLVPVPKVSDWAGLVAHCRRGMRLELDRHLDGREQSVGEAWAAERARLRPLPAERFDSRLRLKARVDPKGRVTVLRNRYSVPVRLCGLPVEVDAAARRWWYVSGPWRWRGMSASTARAKTACSSTTTWRC
jgi:transposase